MKRNKNQKSNSRGRPTQENFLKNTGDFVSKKLEGILKKVLSVVGIQVITDEPITSEDCFFCIKAAFFIPRIYLIRL